MNVTQLALPGLFLLEPQVHADQRGLFFESFNRRAFELAVGVEVDFVQDNHSISSKNVLRGLHYQIGDAAQGKLVRVARGAAFDVVVDVRKDSPTFGRWIGETLSAENRKQLWIPAGFAHGFLALEETEFLYKTTAYYSASSERSIVWDDRDIAIEWPIVSPPVISEKDATASSFGGLRPYDLP